eukprot:4386134-Alexandrium_andersonii.AAC.1
MSRTLFKNGRFTRSEESYGRRWAEVTPVPPQRLGPRPSRMGLQSRRARRRGPRRSCHIRTGPISLMGRNTHLSLIHI